MSAHNNSNFTAIATTHQLSDKPTLSKSHDPAFERPIRAAVELSINATITGTVLTAQHPSFHSAFRSPHIAAIRVTNFTALEPAKQAPFKSTIGRAVHPTHGPAFFAPQLTAVEPSLRATIKAAYLRSHRPALGESVVAAQ